VHVGPELEVVGVHVDGRHLVLLLLLIDKLLLLQLLLINKNCLLQRLVLKLYLLLLLLGLIDYDVLLLVLLDLLLLLPRLFTFLRSSFRRCQRLSRRVDYMSHLLEVRQRLNLERKTNKN
jgi:hypothetical protein